MLDGLLKVEGATVYGVEKRKKIYPETTAWQNGDYSSALKFQLTHLESGKTYQLQFRSTNANYDGNFYATLNI